MANWLFSANAQGWTDYEGGPACDWTGSEGSPGVGCLYNDVGPPWEFYIGSLSIDLDTSSQLSLKWRIVVPADQEPATADITFFNLTDTVEVDSGVDTGWMVLSGLYDNVTTITSAIVPVDVVPEIVMTVYIDSVYIDEASGVTYDLTRSAGGISGSIAT